MKQFDFIIIGAGIAGMSAAYALSHHGKVAILEREDTLAYHSTGRSAATFNRYTCDTGLILSLAQASYPFFNAPPKGFTDQEILTDGTALYVAEKDDPIQEKRLENILHNAEKSGGIGIVQELSLQETIDKSPILKPEKIGRAVFDPSAYVIDVHGLYEGYRKTSRQQGTEIFLKQNVQKLIRKCNVWTVKTDQESFSAPIIINAAGAWADEIAKCANVKPIGLEPKRRTVISIDLPEKKQKPHLPFTLFLDYKLYFKQENADLFVSPMDETNSVPTDAQAEEIDIAIAADRLQCKTSLHVSKINHSWAGLRSFAPDQNPVCGFAPDAEGFFWLAGQGGYGIKTSHALSRGTEDLIINGTLSDDLKSYGITKDQLSPKRFS